MSIQAMAWVLEHSRAEGSDRLVLLAIANHADAEGGLAWPSVSMIAGEARVDRATVYRCLPRLVGLGELEVESGGRGRGVRNTYTLKGWQSATLRPVSRVASDHIKGRISSYLGSHSCDIEPSVTVKNLKPRDQGSQTATPNSPREVTADDLYGWKTEDG